MSDLEPLEFAMRLADFDLDLLPINREMLQGNPDLLREAVSQFFADYFAKVGGKANILSTSDKVAITWTPSSLADKDSLLEYTTKLIQQGATKQARAILESMAKKYPDDYAVLMSLGAVLDEEKDYSLAINVFQRAAKANPGDVYAWASLGLTYHKRGNIGRALEALTHAESLQPDNPEVLGNLGVVLRKKDPEKALPYLKKAAELKPDNQVNALALAMCLIDLKQYVEADKVLGKILEIAPHTKHASTAMELRTQLASKFIKAGNIAGLRLDVVRYCMDALNLFAKLGAEKAKTLTSEIALLGRNGFDVNSPEQKYSLKSLPGSFTGMQLLSYMYVGLKQLDPAVDVGVDFSKELEEAKRRILQPNEDPIPISPPEWDRKNPSASFRAFAESIHEQAKRVFLHDKNHAEFLFFMPVDGKGHIVHTRFDDRDKQAAWVKQHINEHYIFGVIHICEAWIRLAQGKNDHVLKQVIDGEIKVSELREEDRSEALTVTAQTRDGYSMAWIDEIIRDKKSGNVSLKPTLKLQDFEGRFGKLFG